MRYEKGFSAIGVIISVVVILAIMMGGVYFFMSHASTTPPVTSSSGQPTEKVTDMAPSLPNTQKTSVVVMHSDSSYEKFLVPNTTVDTYVKSLPQGDKVISQTSPAK